MAGQPNPGRPFRPLSLGRCSVQTSSDRFGPRAPAAIRVRERAFWGHPHLGQDVPEEWPDPRVEDNDYQDSIYGLVPSVLRFRNNMTALSSIYNLYFVAYVHRIFVYRPREGAASKLPTHPDLQLQPEPTPAGMSGGGAAIDEELNGQSITHIVTGMLGDKEIVLVSYDNGDAVAYYIDQIASLVLRRHRARQVNSRGVALGGEPEPFFRVNVGKSAWGLAIHQRSRLIAVSSNKSEVTVFAFGLSDPSAPPLVGGEMQPKEDCDLEEFVRRRRWDWRIIIGLRSESSNIPNICFLDGPKGLAEQICAVDIEGGLSIADIWRPRQPVRRIPPNKRKEFWSDERMGRMSRGWGVMAFLEHHFMPVNTSDELLGLYQAASLTLRKHGKTPSQYSVNIFPTLDTIPGNPCSPLQSARLPMGRFAVNPQDAQNVFFGTGAGDDDADGWGMHFMGQYDASMSDSGEDVDGNAGEGVAEAGDDEGEASSDEADSDDDSDHDGGDDHGGGGHEANTGMAVPNQQFQAPLSLPPPSQANQIPPAQLLQMHHPPNETVTPQTPQEMQQYSLGMAMQLPPNPFTEAFAQLQDAVGELGDAVTALVGPPNPASQSSPGQNAGGQAPHHADAQGSIDGVQWMWMPGSWSNAPSAGPPPVLANMADAAPGAGRQSNSEEETFGMVYRPHVGMVHPMPAGEAVGPFLRVRSPYHRNNLPMEARRAGCDAKAPDYSLLRTYEKDAELLRVPGRGRGGNEDEIGVVCSHMTLCRELGTDEMGERFSASSRMNLLAHIPELCAVVLGSATGRVVLATLTRMAQGPTREFKGRYTWDRGFRVEWVLPRTTEEATHRSKRWAWPLYGVAVGPVPSGSDGRGGQGRGGVGPGPGPEEREAAVPRRFRLMLHYQNHLMLTYEVSRDEQTSKLVVI